MDPAAQRDLRARLDALDGWLTAEPEPGPSIGQVVAGDPAALDAWERFTDPDATDEDRADAARAVADSPALEHYLRTGRSTG